MYFEGLPVSAVAAIQEFLAPRNLGFVRTNFAEGKITFKLGGALCVVVGTSPLEGGIRQCCVGLTKLAEDGECTIDVSCSSQATLHYFGS